jgi:hypothetical protein
MTAALTMAGLVIIIAASAQSQSPSANTWVHVTDPAGSDVSRAWVQFNCQSGDKPFVVSTDHNGIAALNLPQGPCDLSVSGSGFELVRESDVETHPPYAANLEVGLTPGYISGPVAVLATFPDMPTGPALLSTPQIPVEPVETLPLRGRSTHNRWPHL